MVQAYSIGKDTRKNISTAPKFVPGPGAYDSTTKDLTSMPSWGFGSSKRPKMALSQASKDIGPGQYQVPQKAVEGSRYSMGGINYKQKKYGSLAPGPGAYQPKNGVAEKSLSYSMGSKFESCLTNKEAGKSPGPGGYNPKMNFKNDGHTKFGTGQRAGIMDEKKAKFVPSPFAYKQDAQFIQKTMPKFSFGSEKQRPNTSNTKMNVPGPGHYPSKTIVGSESVGKTMGMKICPSFDKPGSNKVPGPGAYDGNYKTTRTSEAAWKIGTGTRYDRDNIMRRTCNFPPMNAYDPDYRKTQGSLPKWGFGSSVRGGLVEGKVISPSMQTYNIPSKTVEHSSWSMGLKLSNSCAIGADSNKQKQLPGPGAYQPDFGASQNKKPLYSMKGRYKEPKKLDVPGPGTYDKSMTDKQSAPQYGFGSSPQREPIQKTLSPGPGGYHIPVKLAEVPAYALPSRKDDVKYI